MITGIEAAGLIAAAVAEIVKLIAAGVSHDVAMKRIQRLSEGAHVVDADVDAAATPSEPSDR